MAACTKYLKRFLTALKHREVESLEQLKTVMTKRATSDRQLDAVIHSILDIIEPPSCQKSHCPHHTTYAFCNCSQNLVPGKCSLNLEYLKKKRQKEQKVYDERLLMIPVKFFPLSKENEQKIRRMTDTEFKKAIKKLTP